MRVFKWLIGFGFLVGYLVHAQIGWDPAGVPVRQGHHIEWNRAGASDGAGGAIYLWSDCRNGQRDLFAQRVAGDGNLLWGEGGTVVCAELDRQEDPVVVVDGAGGVVVAWVDFRADTAGDIYAQRISGAGELLWDPAGVPLCTAFDIQIAIGITGDGAGGIIVAWVDSRSGADGDIYAQRVDGSGQVPPGWPLNGVAVCAQPGGQSGLTIEDDGAGGAIIAWWDRRQANDHQIYAQWVGANGQLLWEEGGTPVCDFIGNQDHPKLIPDGSGGVYIVWHDQREDDGDLYIQRMDGSGFPQWPDGGIGLCTLPKKQQNPRLVPDGAGGAIVIWHDNRNDPTNTLADIYAQRISPDGTLLWDTDGAPVCTADGDQIEARLRGDGFGGVVVAWEDERNGGIPYNDIYAQRLNTDGDTLWAADGILVSGANYHQFSPLVREDGSGGAILAWGDTRKGSPGIYVQHIGALGTPLWPGEDGFQLEWGIDGDAKHPRVIPKGSAQVLAIWEDQRLGRMGTRVFAQTLDTTGLVQWWVNGNDAGLWADVNSYIGDYYPVITPDGTGGGIIASEARVDDSLQIFLQRIDSHGDTLWGRNGIHLFPTGHDQIKPTIVGNGEGGAFVGWTDFPYFSDPNVYLQRVDSSGGILWGSAGEQISLGFGEDFPYGSIYDGQGGSFIVWRGGFQDYNIFVQHLDGDGGVVSGWPPGGLVVSGAVGNQVYPRAVPDGFGGVIVVWEDGRDASTELTTDIYAQRVAGDGTILWKVEGPDSLSGLPVVMMPNDQKGPVLAADGQEGVFIGWKDFRNGIDNNIYAQWISGVGECLWEENGVPICSAFGNQSQPAILRAAPDRIIIAWEDYRSGAADIYAQELNENGMGLWGENGAVVCDYHNHQVDPILVTDYAGGAIVLWEDLRSSGKALLRNIYAQRVNDLWVGIEGNGLHGGITSFELFPNYPNPFNASTTLHFRLAQQDWVDLVVYNIRGRLVCTLYTGPLFPGEYRVGWDGNDELGRKVASGIYFGHLKTVGSGRIRKMILLR
ncbi:T9SS type A sorting domain-containing protein [candidate division KSB1 bacterium]|nr:T9SS type A sorting domain-containing protein [candidate division KSB1 bacterium]